MKSIRLFFAGVTLSSVAYLATTIMPETARANPKTLATGESALARWLLNNDREEQATQMDRTSRWFMAPLYLVMIAALYFSYTA